MQPPIISNNITNGLYWLPEDKRTTYPFSTVSRAIVCNQEYYPNEYTEPKNIGYTRPVWADPQDVSTIKFNQVDGNVNRVSHTGVYSLDTNGRPLCPLGRTGITGRGILGCWGPNHAADPIVTRYKRDSFGIIMLDQNGHQRIEFVAIKRRDNGQWAIPGGMVERGTDVSKTLRTEFGEEALATLEASPEDKLKLSSAVENFFSKGLKLVFKGVVHDWRNTDNAWMETVAVVFHDYTGDVVSKFPLKAGDDAGDVAWTEIVPSMNLFASHSDFVMKARDIILSS